MFIARSLETALAELLLLIIPSAMISLLFGSQLINPVDTAVGRYAGVALFALGVGWWMFGKGGHNVGRIIGTMLFYDAAVLVVLLSARFTQRLNGIGLWPAIALHLGLGIWCLVCLSRQNRANK